MNNYDHEVAPLFIKYHGSKSSFKQHPVYEIVPRRKRTLQNQEPNNIDNTENSSDDDDDDVMRMMQWAKMKFRTAQQVVPDCSST